MAHALEIAHFGTTNTTKRSAEEPFSQQWSKVTVLQFPTWLREVCDQVSGLRTLETNWDSHGGIAASAKAVSISKRILSTLDLEWLPRPDICAIADGGVGMHWRIADRDLELEITADGKIHFLKTIIGSEPSDGILENLEDGQPVIDWVIGA